MFDMIDLNAEISKAKTTLGAADSIFQRHALRFDNEINEYDENMSLAQRIDRARKVASQEVPDPKKPQVKLMRLVPVEPGSEPMNAVEAAPPPQLRKPRIDPYIDNPYIDNEPRRGSKRSYTKRKKSVSF